MKLIFMICVIYGIPVIEGIPNNYEQMLEPRGITDSFYDWWYGEPENDEYETISQDDRQDTTWEEINKSESQYTQFIPNESGKRVIPVDKITPQRKVEPIEDLLEELNEEIRQSSDNEEKKDIMNTLTEIKSDLQETPSRFVNVMINKAWRVFDIGNIGSSRRTRSIESIGMLTTIIQWLLSILSMSIFSWHGGQNNTSHEALIPKWFTSNQNGAPVNVQSSSVIGLPGDKNDKTLDIGKLRGDQDMLVVFLKKDKTEDNKDKVDYDIKGDTQDEKINNINELLKKNNLSNKTKLLILVELTKMYDDDLDDKTKKRIIYLILVISKAPEFKETLEAIGKSEDAEYEKARNLFIKERNSLQKKYDDIENSTSKDIDKEKDIISKTNNKPSTEYHIITVDENMKLKQDKEIDKDKLKDLLKNIGNSHMSKDHANDVKQSVISAHEHDASKNTSLPDKVEPDKTAKLLQGEKEISQVSQSAFPSSKVTTDPLSKKEQPNKFEPFNNPEYYFISTYYPYNETSDRVKFYYDPQKKTYKDKNSTTELDDIFEKIMSITEHDQHTPQTVKSKIVEDLVECNDFAMELKEDTEKKLMRTIEEVGKSPKFTFIEDLKKLKIPTDYAKHVLYLFGKVPGEVENTSQPNPEIVNTQWQSTLNGPYTKISSTTYTHSYNCPQVSQPINSMKRSKNLREKIKFYIDTQNALKLLNTDINQEAYRQYKQGVETELQDTQYDNLRREFLDKVPSQDILSELRELNEYLTNNNIVGKNDQEEKDAIRGYLSKPN